MGLVRFPYLVIWITLLLDGVVSCQVSFAPLCPTMMQVIATAIDATTAMIFAASSAPMIFLWIIVSKAKPASSATDKMIDATR